MLTSATSTECDRLLLCTEFIYIFVSDFPMLMVLRSPHRQRNPQ